MSADECVCAGSALQLVSLFDGIAGFPEAFRRAGVATRATVEIDKAAAGVAADHFPEAKAFTDIMEVTADDILGTGFCPVHGVFSAGWPCTDLSLAGLRLGLGGARSGLVGEVFRLLLGVRPRWFVLENVPGLLSSVCPCPGGETCSDPRCLRGSHAVPGGACGRKRAGRRYAGPGRCMALHGGGMGTVLRRLVECGYGVSYRVLDAQHFGVPQRRRRVVIVGHLGDWARPVEVLLEPDRGNRGAEAGGATGTDTVAGADRGAQGGGQPGDVTSTIQGGGRRGFRIDSESAAGGHLLVDVRGEGVYESALTANMAGGGGGADDNTAQGGHLLPLAVAVTVTASGSQSLDPEMETLVPTTLRGQVTHALTAEGADASEDGTGRGTPIVAYALRRDPGRPRQGHNTNYVPVDLAQVTSATNRSNPPAGDPAGTLPLTSRPAVAFGHTNGIGVQESESVTPTLRAGHGVGGGSVATAAAVRRLTPVECERLQGYPDGWTATSHGKEQADSPRYRQLGNSIAVPVFEWVARRLVEVDARSRGDAR